MQNRPSPKLISCLAHSAQLASRLYGKLLLLEQKQNEIHAEDSAADLTELRKLSEDLWRRLISQK